MDSIWNLIKKTKFRQLKYLFGRLGGKRLFILTASLAMFIMAVVVNRYIIGRNFSLLCRRLIQKDVLAKEDQFLASCFDTVLLVWHLKQDLF